MRKMKLNENEIVWASENCVIRRTSDPRALGMPYEVFCEDLRIDFADSIESAKQIALDYEVEIKR
jgi:hypothetical protein